MTQVKLQTANPFNRLFNDFFFAPVYDAPAAAYQPAVNIAETDQGFRLEIAAPGLNKEDITLKVEQKHLIVSGKKTAEQTEDTPKYHRREFAIRQFERSFRLPESIDSDQVTATLTNGILHIELVKRPDAQPIVKTISVN